MLCNAFQAKEEEKQQSKIFSTKVLSLYVFMFLCVLLKVLRNAGKSDSKSSKMPPPPPQLNGVIFEQMVLHFSWA